MFSKGIESFSEFLGEDHISRCDVGLKAECGHKQDVSKRLEQ